MDNINKGQPTVYDYVFPVFGGHINDKGQFVPLNIYGTAFYIKNNCFVTCAHTINNAAEHEVIALGFQNPENVNEVSFVKVQDTETFDENDSGILVTYVSRAKAYPWLPIKLAMLNDVFSIGYPYGFDIKNAEILVRSFKGHIILAGYYTTFPNRPSHYELSYQCPRGLSGGPLLFKNQSDIYICGMTIGNEITDMVVSSFREVNEHNNKVEVYEKTESLHRGIAMQCESFLQLKSRILGDTFYNYLRREDLLK